MASETIDLRYAGTTCTSHPVIRLSNRLTQIKDSSDVRIVEIYFWPEVIPVEVAKMYASKAGFTVIEEKKLDDGSYYIKLRRE